MNFLLYGTNASLLAASFLRALWAGKADRVPAAPKSVLVVQLAKLGDMVCTTPMFRAIKKRYPNCRVIVMGDAVNKEVLADSADVDGYIVYRGIFQTIREIRKQKPDFAALAGPGPAALAVLYLAGVPAIAAPFIVGGFCPHETKSYKQLLRLVLKRPHQMGRYAAREYLRLLEPIGIFEDDTTKHLSSGADFEELMRFFLSRRGIGPADFLVGIAPGTGHKIKLWDPKKFAEVIRYLWEKYQAKIFIIGGRGDREEVQKVIAVLGDAVPVVNMLEWLNIKDLKAFIARLNLFISVDTGPVYIAEAFGVPTVDIVGPMDENEQPPRGEKHKVVVASREAPAIHVMNTRVYDEKEARRQSEDITAAMVIAAIEQLRGLSR